MVHASYRSKGVLYEVVKATLDGVQLDMEYALQNTQYVDREVYRSRMEESVQQGLGYRLLRDGIRMGVMYNMVENEEYVGCSLYCKNDRVGMMILMKSMFEIYDSHKMKIMPHDGDVGYFLSMATTNSLIGYHARGTPLVIAKKDVVIKGEKMFKYLEIEVL